MDTAKYFVKFFQFVSTQDLPGLPEVLIDDLPFFRDLLEVVYFLSVLKTLNALATF